MNLPDDIQELWQQDNSQKENPAMWMQLIQEKRRGFDELVRAENQAEYLLALIFGSLLPLLAVKAKFPWAQVGFGLLAAAMVVLAIATRICQRLQPRQNDDSLREHLEALMESYDRRIRFMRNGKFLVNLALSAGLIAVVLGIPGYESSPGAWSFVAIVLTAIWSAQWYSYVRARASIWKKREEAERLLRELPCGLNPSRVESVIAEPNIPRVFSREAPAGPSRRRGLYETGRARRPSARN